MRLNIILFSTALFFLACGQDKALLEPQVGGGEDQAGKVVASKVVAGTALRIHRVKGSWAVTSGTEQDKIGRVTARGVKQGRIKYSFGAAAAGFSIARNSGYVSYDGTPIDAARARLRIVAEDRDEVATDVSHVQYVDVTQPASIEQEPDPVPPDSQDPVLDRQTVDCDKPQNLHIEERGTNSDGDPYVVFAWNAPCSDPEYVRKYHVLVRPLASTNHTGYSAFVQDEVGGGQYHGYGTRSDGRDRLYKSRIDKEIVHHVAYQGPTSGSNQSNIRYNTHTHPIASGTTYKLEVRSLDRFSSDWEVATADLTY